MSHVKRLAVFLLHLAAQVLVQLCLLRMLLKENELSVGTALVHALFAALVCLLDLGLSCRLLRGQALSRTASMALHFWDVVLSIPILVLGFFGMFSGGSGAVFGGCVLLLDLLLIIERSTVYVLFDPNRKKS
jgi:ABC-type antimicrobial peptide transport system permease subunit